MGKKLSKAMKIANRANREFAWWLYKNLNKVDGHSLKISDYRRAGRDINHYMVSSECAKDAKEKEFYEGLAKLVFLDIGERTDFDYNNFIISNNGIFNNTVRSWIRGYCNGKAFRRYGKNVYLNSLRDVDYNSIFCIKKKNKEQPVKEESSSNISYESKNYESDAQSSLNIEERLQNVKPYRSFSLKQRVIGEYKRIKKHVSQSKRSDVLAPASIRKSMRQGREESITSANLLESKIGYLKHKRDDHFWKIYLSIVIPGLMAGWGYTIYHELDKRAHEAKMAKPAITQQYPDTDQSCTNIDTDTFK